VANTSAAKEETNWGVVISKDKSSWHQVTTVNRQLAYLQTPAWRRDNVHRQQQKKQTAIKDTRKSGNIYMGPEKLSEKFNSMSLKVTNKIKTYNNNPAG